MEAVLIYALVHWNAVQIARGDIVPSSVIISRHADENGCKAAMEERFKKRWGSMSCLPVFHRDAPYNPKEKRSTVSGGVACYGDDRFCGR